MAKELIEHVNPKELTIIGLDTDDGPEHPLYDERIRLDVDENLVKNIQVYGILQPVTVRKEAGGIFVVDGRQRVRAARKASEIADGAGEYGVKVPVRNVNANDARVAGIMISTAIRRNDDVLTCAFKAERLLARLGDIEEVALAFGKSVTTIRNWTLLAAAPASVHHAVRANRISAGAAIELVRSVPREEVADALDALLTQNTDPVSVAQAKRAAQAAQDAAEAASDTGENASSLGAETGAAGSAPPVETPPAAKKSKKTGETKNQSGIRRVWLRRALKTEAAAHLEPEQRAVLQWFATGATEKGTWYDDFVWDASAELDDELKTKTKAKKAKAPEPEPEPEAPAAEAPATAEDDEELDQEKLLAELRDIVSTPLDGDDEDTDNTDNTDKE